MAAQKAKFPAFSNPEVYRDFQKVGFDMWGKLANAFLGVRFVPNAETDIICCFNEYDLHKNFHIISHPRRLSRD